MPKSAIDNRQSTMSASPPMAHRAIAAVGLLAVAMFFAAMTAWGCLAGQTGDIAPSLAGGLPMTGLFVWLGVLAGKGAPPAAE